MCVIWSPERATEKADQKQLLSPWGKFSTRSGHETGYATVSEGRPDHSGTLWLLGGFPRSFLTDTGILHTLLGIDTRDDLERHPKVGASWEGSVVKEVVRQIGARPE